MLTTVHFKWSFSVTYPETRAALVRKLPRDFGESAQMRTGKFLCEYSKSTLLYRFPSSEITHVLHLTHSCGVTGPQTDFLLSSLGDAHFIRHTIQTLSVDCEWTVAVNALTTVTSVSWLQSSVWKLHGAFEVNERIVMCAVSVLSVPALNFQRLFKYKQEEMHTSSGWVNTRGPFQ